MHLTSAGIVQETARRLSSCPGLDQILDISSRSERLVAQCQPAPGPNLVRIFGNQGLQLYSPQYNLPSVKLDLTLDKAV